jgi:two-component system, OmpR family, phosphate regulon sensor histidine kinase PhoR
MKKRLLIFIIVLVSMALSGIIYVQVAYMKNAYAQNEAFFDYKVNEALQSVVKNMDQIQTVEKIYIELEKKKRIANQFPHKPEAGKIRLDSLFEIKINDSLLKLWAPIHADKNQTMAWAFNNEQFSVVYKTDSIQNQGRVILSTGNIGAFQFPDINIRKIPDSKIMNFTIDSAFSQFENKYRFRFEQKFDTLVWEQFNREFAERKEKKVRKVVEKMVLESDKILVESRKKLHYEKIDSLLKSSLQNHELFLPYQYKVVTDTSIKDKPASKGFDEHFESKKYEALLFPDDIVPKNDKIVLYFPERKTHLVKSLSLLLPASLLFSLIIIIAFSISIWMVIRQKKISDIKTDFINNMTHEFKTPIATISLAADTIVNPKIIENQEKITQFIRIIKDENKRMNLQVERILQMALLERNELELKLENIDIHQLIKKSIENLDVQLKKQNGQIQTRFNAVHSNYFIDAVHFTNVINNLLDNALKYTLNPPEIVVTTEQKESGIVVSVQDKGLGMSKEAQSRIFEKFYRVSKGDIHNIKGFGLGLSYVKAIIEAHGGRIGVKSELGKGSRFDLYLTGIQTNNQIKGTRNANTRENFSGRR